MRLIAAALLIAASIVPAAAQLFEGEFEGQKFQIDLTTPEGRLRAVSGAIDLPFTSREQTGETLILAIPGYNFRFEGRLSGARLTGTVQRADRSFEVSLATADPMVPDTRPQDPQAPLPYAAEDVTFPSADAGITLGGTITTPQGPGPFAAVVLVTPDGPQDRNAQGAGHRANLILADALTRAGFVVLRFDDRGIGRSSGDYEAATIDDFGRDAAGALRFIKARAGVDPARVAVVGRGAGAVMAAMAVAAEGAKAKVLVSPPAHGGIDGVQLATERQMRENGSDDDEIKGRLEAQAAVLAVAADPSKQRADIEAAVRAAINAQAGFFSFVVPETAVQAFTRALSGPYLRRQLTFDPAAIYRAATARTLLVYGDKDMANPPTDAPRVEEALRSGGATVETAVLPGLNAALATWRDKERPSERSETIAPAAIERIVEFVRAAL